MNLEINFLIIITIKLSYNFKKIKRFCLYKKYIQYYNLYVNYYVKYVKVTVNNIKKVLTNYILCRYIYLRVWCIIYNSKHKFIKS